MRTHRVYGIEIRNLQSVTAVGMGANGSSFTFEAKRGGLWVAYGPQVYGNWSVASDITRVPFMPQPSIYAPHIATDETVPIGWGSLQLVHDYEQMTADTYEGENQDHRARGGGR